jgi:cell wall-associated NlpC family hydrolase
MAFSVAPLLGRAAVRQLAPLIFFCPWPILLAMLFEVPTSVLAPLGMKRLAFALALMLCSAIGWAAPTDTADPITQFLASKSLLPTSFTASEAAADTGPTSRVQPRADAPNPPSAPANPGLVQQMRDRASDMVITAMNFLGVPYKRGGNSAETGFDCSGFTRHIFEMSVGLVLPRRADEQASAPSLLSVQRDELKPGDLVFFNTLKRTFSHVGIYVGEGKFIHAPRTGAEVRVENMRQAYWSKRFTGARRAPQMAASEIVQPLLTSAPVPSVKPVAAKPSLWDHY